MDETILHCESAFESGLPFFAFLVAFSNEKLVHR